MWDGYWLAAVLACAVVKGPWPDSAYHPQYTEEPDNEATWDSIFTYTDVSLKQALNVCAYYSNARRCSLIINMQTCLS